MTIQRLNPYGSYIEFQHSCMLQHLIASHTYIIEIIAVNMLCAVIAWSSLISVLHWLRLLSAADNDSRIVCLNWLGLT